MSDRASSVFWSAEWEKLNLGAKKAPAGAVLNKLLFVECGFGVDQHGKAEATKAAVRACRNAVEFNSIPGVIDVVPGGRANMLIRVKLGVPSLDPANPLVPLTVDLNEGFAPLHGVQHPTSEPLHAPCLLQWPKSSRMDNFYRSRWYQVASPSKAAVLCQS
jgi:hypothetical protein